MTLLRRAIKRARASLFWERLWPLVAALLTAIGLFLAFSWAGLWLALSPLARAIALFPENLHDEIDRVSSAG